jgi:hypothetical protein
MEGQHVVGITPRWKFQTVVLSSAQAPRIPRQRRYQCRDGENAPG